MTRGQLADISHKHKWAERFRAGSSILSLNFLCFNAKLWIKVARAIAGEEESGKGRRTSENGMRMTNVHCVCDAHA